MWSDKQSKRKQLLFLCMKTLKADDISTVISELTDQFIDRSNHPVALRQSFSLCCRSAVPPALAESSEPLNKPLSPNSRVVNPWLWYHWRCRRHDFHLVFSHKDFYLLFLLVQSTLFMHCLLSIAGGKARFHKSSLNLFNGDF